MRLHSGIPQMRLCEPIRMYVCTEDGCHVAIMGESLISHLRRKHKLLAAVARREAGELASRLGHLNESPLEKRYLQSPYPAAGERFLPALPILPVFDILKCPLCPMYSKGRKACSTHLRSKHISDPSFKTALQTISSKTCVKGQTIFNGNQLLLFPVHLPSTSAQTGRTLTDTATKAATSALFSERSDQEERSEQIALRDKTQNFTCKLLGIPDFLRRHSLSVDRAFEVTNVPCRATYGNVLQLLLLYVKHFADMDPPVPLPIIEFIKIKHEKCQSSFTLSLPLDTKKRYSRVLTRFICAIANLESIRIPSLPIPDSMIHQAKKLTSHSLSSACDILADVHYLLRSMLLGSVRASQGETIMLEVVFKLVMAGFSRSKEMHRARIGGAEDASHTAAALQYFCHVAALGEFMVQPLGFGIARRDGTESEQERRERIQNMIRTDACTPAAYIRTVLSKTKRLSAAEAPEVPFAMCHSHKYCGSVNNIEISMNSDGVPSLGSAVRRLQQESWKILREELMLSYSVPSGIWETILSFPDNIRAKDPGLFFGDSEHSRDRMRQWASEFMVYLAGQKSSPCRRNDKGGSVSFLPSKHAGDWLHLVDKLTRNLYILFHISCGGPPRVTEMNAMRLKNTSAGHRNLYLYHRKLSILTSYSKTSQQFEKPKPIARFIDENTTELALCFITYIKPLQMFLFLSLFGDRMGIEDYMFCKGGEPIPEGEACNAFREKLAKEGVPLTVSLYRHYRTGMVKSYMQEFAHLSADSVAFMQAGHSESTANHRYGIVEFDFDNFNTAAVEGFLRVSERWHEMLGISRTSTGITPTISACQHDTEVVCGETDVAVEGSVQKGMEYDNHPVHAKSVHNFVGGKRVLPRVVPPLPNRTTDSETRKDHGTKRTLHSEHEKSHPFRNTVGAKRSCSALGDGHFQEVAPAQKKAVHLDIHQALRILLGKTCDASLFKSEAQKSAVYECAMQSIYSNYESSMLVILPTGGGKTVCWAAPAVQEQYNSEMQGKQPRKTVVVVPLISLRKDLLRRCADYNIKAVDWENRFDSTASVVFCSVENVITGPYRDFVVALSANGMLLRVVVDEVHLIELWKGFRAFAHVRTRLRPVDTSIPLVLMTATSPPCLVEDIKQSVGVNDFCFKIIRAPTGRKNISYTVLRVPSTSDDEMVHSCASLIHSELLCLSKEEKVIAYCLTIGDAVKLASRLRMTAKGTTVCLYYGEMSLEDREEQFERWLTSEGQATMIATGAFSCGIDYYKVRKVIHVGGARTLVELVQEAGRLGRDGIESTSIVVFNQEYFERKTRRPGSWKQGNSLQSYAGGQSDQRDAKFGSFQQYATNATKCRRTIIEPFMDGNSRGPCESDESTCDICLSHLQPEHDRQQLADPEKVQPSRNENGRNNFNRQSRTCRTDEINERSTFTEGNILPEEESPSCTTVAGMTPESSAHCKELDIPALIWKSQQLGQAQCPKCALNRAKKILKHCNGQCMRGRCFRCMEPAAPHKSKECHVTPRGKKGAKRCFFCGIPDSKDIHAPGTFDKQGKCHWELVKNIALLMWRNMESRKRLMLAAPILRGVGDDYVLLGKLLCGGEEYSEKVWLLSIVDVVYKTVFLKH